MDSEIVYKLGASTVLWVQTHLQFLESFLLWCSRAGDPRNSFLVFFPICYAFSRNFGVQCLWISSLTEWTNALLKWLFNDDRPYWWVKEKKFDSPNHELKQFSVTCETGPGFPSGHVMSVTAVGLHIALALDNFIDHAPHLSLRLKTLLKILVYATYFFMIMSVALSRVYVSTHFPHQVFVAAFIGTAVTFAVHKVSSYQDLSSSLVCSVSSITMLIVAIVFYKAIILSGYDPSFTVCLAKKWSRRKSWVHLDTTPFFAITRDCGTLFGLGMSTFLDSRSAESFSCFSLLLTLIFDFIFVKTVESINIFHEQVMFFYLRAYLKFALLPIIITVLTPYVLESFEMTLQYVLC